jgi:myo-inositol-1(or 4)-monophosphatase
MQPQSPLSEYPDAETRVTLERCAVRLARMAGDQICHELTSLPAVEFKPPVPGSPANGNPVSSTDRHVESLIRARLGTGFPDHAVIGEEYALTDGRDVPYTWVIDPVDGTSNYINGVPLFAASVGVLFRGRPVAGAIWCASSHALRPGVYHAHAGGSLCFDERPMVRRGWAAWRGLAAEPGRAPTYGALWDTRVFGCATLEFAFVAAGLLSLAYIPRPALWDAAAGMVLLHAAHCHAVALRGDHRDTLLYFEAGGDRSAAALARWTEPLLIGDEAALRSAQSVLNAST